jgi:uncharacterized phage protein (TIGR01671 family)
LYDETEATFKVGFSCKAAAIWGLCNIEVIGNIYENPEILEEQ